MKKLVKVHENGSLEVDSWQEALEKLAAYEATNIEPGEIEVLMELHFSKYDKELEEEKILCCPSCYYEYKESEV